MPPHRPWGRRRRPGRDRALADLGSRAGRRHQAAWPARGGGAVPPGPPLDFGPVRPRLRGGPARPARAPLGGELREGPPPRPRPRAHAGLRGRSARLAAPPRARLLGHRGGAKRRVHQRPGHAPAASDARGFLEVAGRGAGSPGGRPRPAPQRLRIPRRPPGGWTERPRLRSGRPGGRGRRRRRFRRFRREPGLSGGRPAVASAGRGGPGALGGRPRRGAPEPQVVPARGHGTLPQP
mmetsp:Transcript_37698/g.84199  ORF Transcript_37698/g.84199 Transcript_37698/m.84199 type:complete len:237 (+) Transcript_37698:524-1234(+)